EFEGSAGIPIGGVFRKMALAMYLGDGTKFLFSDYVKPNSLLLMRRAVRGRAQTNAPFLMFDDDPFIVIGKDGRLSWILDAYTYTRRYPYATQYRVGSKDVNYFRNSVKVVINAYDGSITFYVFEPDDAIVKSYRQVFPSLFRDASEMP